MTKETTIAKSKPPRKGEEGCIVRIQKFCIQDGPGIRTTVFLKGCPLHCLWCSNPETQIASAELEYDRARCIAGCYECVELCSEGAIANDGQYITVNRDKCTGCGKCAAVCYSRALLLVGQKMHVEQVVDEVKRDMPFYEKSGGGVTLSGGEPLFKPEFAGQIAKRCKQAGISTALNTCGQASWKILQGVLEHIDLVLYDIKHMDSEEHKRYTGVANSLILHNARKISEAGIPLVLRIPVIPGINDTPNNMRQLAEFILSLPRVSEVHLLPYHRIGASKYPLLGRDYLLAKLLQPEKEHILWVKELLESHRVKTSVVS